MDLNKSIRMAVDTGKVVFGSQRAKKLALTGSCKALVLSANCPAPVKQDIEHYCSLSKIPIIRFEGNGIKLGTVCGKPFTIAALSVIDAGNSDILSEAK